MKQVDNMTRRVAVIGSGSSGLASIKTCLDEGLEPVCFETSDDIGGLWRFKETPEPERSGIYRSLVVNTSKEMMCYSDFPMPAHYPNFMHNSQLLQYLRLYAEHFDLRRHIHFQTKVRRVRQRPDFSVSGQWEVVTENRDGEEARHIFDGVLVCSGHYTHPVIPLDDFPGHEAFPGRYLHSWEYKDANAFRMKRVVVVGIGNSGGDIAVEISRSAEKTFLSTRQGSWVVGRMSHSGLPLDMDNTRLNNVLPLVLPKALVNWMAERTLNQRYDHRLYGLLPKHRLLDRKPLINDDLPDRILQGALVMKPNLCRFQGSDLVFEDGTVEENIDAVVFCTGYSGTFQFLPSSLSDGPGGELTLYKRLFPPSLERPTLAIMGLFQTKDGSIVPMMEMQARWATRVIAGSTRLPPKEKMLAVIESDRKTNMICYPSPREAALQVDYIPYMDLMAKEIGARPNVLGLLLRDPVLGLKVFLGPCTPYQYRLTGPGRWAGARQAILTQWDRIVQPFRTREVPEPETRPYALLSPWLLTLSGAAVMVAVLFTQNNLTTVLKDPAQILDSFNTLLRGSG